MYSVYAHINKINGKIYIGQTSVEPTDRWKNGNAYKNSRYFWNAIQKYGWDNFEHTVLFNDLTQEEADYFEELLIKKFNTTERDKGYNLKLGGVHAKYSDESKRLISEHHADVNGKNNPFYGKHHNEKTKQILREKSTGRNKGEKSTRFGKHHTEEALAKMRGDRESVKGSKNPRARKINQYDLGGHFIRSYWGCKEATELFGYDNSSIGKCCKGEQETSYGYIWRYADE